jgi:hypothetical protein
MLNKEEGEMEISKTHCQASGKTPKTSPRQCDPGYIKSPWLRANGGGDIWKVTKNVAKKSRLTRRLLQVRAPSQEKQEGADPQWAMASHNDG